MRGFQEEERQPEHSAAVPGRGGGDGGLAVSDGGDAGAEGLQRSGEHGQQPQDGRVVGRLAYSTRERLERRRNGSEGIKTKAGGLLSAGSGVDANFWSAFDLIPCADGKARRVEPGTFPLAHGVSSRVGRLRAYGNAIVPQVAAEFVRAFMEATE